MFSFLRFEPKFTGSYKKKCVFLVILVALYSDFRRVLSHQPKCSYSVCSHKKLVGATTRL